MKRISVMQGHWGKLATGAAVGLVTMYFSDPKQGRRRRALVRDKVRHLSVKTSDAGDAALRDFSNRLEGTRARLRRFLNANENTMDDQVIVASARAKLGHQVTHPHSIEVTSRAGHVVLNGHILAHEKTGLLDAVRELPGVIAVEDQLQSHATAEHISALQGEGKRSRPAENWTPALRGAAILGGGALSALGLLQRTPAGALLSAAGVALLARGATNMSLHSMAGFGARNRGIDLQKTILINALPETVFDIWTSYENFPYFMSHVLDVRDLGDQRSHWIVEGPAGARIEWRAVQTQYIRPSALAWETEPGAPIEHHGSVWFEPAEDGATRVTVRMHYSPPAGIIGHTLASLFGVDPKHRLDDDLMRMKSFIESGLPPHDAAIQPGVHGEILH